jgi:hypothetical protein
MRNPALVDFGISRHNGNTMAFYSRSLRKIHIFVNHKAKNSKKNRTLQDSAGKICTFVFFAAVFLPLGYMQCGNMDSPNKK